MKDFSVKSFLMALLIIPLTAGAKNVGGVDGGGGMGYVCYSKNVQDSEITQVYVLDFYEAMVLRNLSFPKTVVEQDTAALVELLKDLILQSRSVTEQALVLELSSINSNLYKSLLPRGVRLPPVVDGDPIVKPEGCERDQLAYYRDNPGNQLGKFANLLIVGDYWEKMDNLNRACLLVHEAVYRIRRDLGDTNSDTTRNLIGDALEKLSNP